jgi:hypothetical protein
VEVYVRAFVTAVLIAALTVTLVEAPVLAAPASAPSAPLGVVVSAENATVGAGVITGGATVYDGDRLQTPDHGTLRVRLGAEQLVLRSDTDTEVHAIPNGFSAKLYHGSVLVSSAVGQTFELEADGVTIRPANGQQASGQITMITPKELVLTSTHGSLLVSMDDEVNTVEEGKSYRVEVESDDSEAGPTGTNQNPPNPTARRRKRFLYILVPTVTIVTAIAIWRAVISPNTPSAPTNLTVSP